MQISGVPATGAVSFPATTVGGSAVVQNIQLTTTAMETITSIQVPASLGSKQEFVVGSITGCVVDGSTMNASGTTCNVPITFKPAYPGPRNLPLQVVTGTGNIEFGLSGTGVAPLAVLAPALTTVLTFTISNEALTNGVTVDGVGNAYVAQSDRNIIIRVDATTGATTTIAGTGIPDFNNDNIPATQAYLYNPSGVAVDAAGDVFIADTNNNKVREVFAATGLINSVAGGANGGYQSSGFSGDGGPSYYAFVNAPTGLALDSAGDLYIADTGNNAIRRIDAVSGNMSSVAGMGAAPAGYSGDGGLATAATLNAPGGIAVDAAGDLFISDSGNNVIRRVDGVTGKISTIAGTGTAGYGGDGGAATQALLSGPASLALDAAGNLYIADQNNYRVRKIEFATGKIFSVAGNGTVPVNFANRAGNTGSATSFSLGAVTGVAIDPVGNIYLTESDAFNNDIFKISANNAVVPYPTVTQVNTADSTDDPATVFVSNDGNAALSVTSPTSGSNPSIPANWLYDSASTCQQLAPAGTAYTVAKGSSCALDIDFQPTSTGSLTGTVTVADNSLNVAATQTASLSGTSATAASTTSTLGFSFVPNYPPGYMPVYPSLDYDSLDTLTVTVTHTAAGVTGAINGTVTFYDNGTAMANGQNLAVTNGTASFTFEHVLPVGSNVFTAVFTPGNSSSLNSSTAPALTESVAQGTPAISASINNAVYDGNPHGVTITTVPANLPVTINYVLQGSYSGSTTPPTAAGTYQANIYINTTDYYLSTYVALNIYKLLATVTLANLEAVYNGSPHAATAATSPAGLTVNLYYNGSATAPTAAGRYEVGGVIVDPVYQGAAYGTLEIYNSGTATTTWIVNQDGTVAHLNAAGAVTSTAGTASGASSYGAIAIDNTGNAWAVSSANNSVLEVSSTGTLSGTYTGGGVSAPVGIAIDGAGQVWVANSTNSVSVLSNAGAAVTPSTGYLAATTYDASPLATPSAIAIDATGSVWITNASGSTVTRVLGAAAPVVTPSVLGVASSTEGSRP